jgi:TPR repeat protein
MRKIVNMKANSNIVPERIDGIGTARERLVTNCSMLILNSYSKVRIDDSIEYQQSYIEATLYVVDFLYQFYDLDPIYFSLLDHAVHTLEKLAFAEDQKEMLAEYCDRAAVVFQTAADKTRQNPIYKRIWSIKSKEYREKADAIRGIASDITHEERIMQLYETFAKSMPHEFIKNLLLDNYKRYRNGYTVDEPQSDINGLRYRGRKVAQNEERTPLLNGFFRGRPEAIENRIRTAQRLCEAGNARGQYEMATRYRYGWGVPQNQQQALNLYKMAAERGLDAHAGACYELVRLYLHGDILMGIKKNIAAAAYYAKLGANADPNVYNYSEYHGSATADYDQRRYIEESVYLLRVIETQLTGGFDKRSAYFGPV